MEQNVTLLAAFAAGFLSFVSPCVLPLIPGYISFVSGVSLDEMRADTTPAASRLQVFMTSVAFVIGFSLVFVALGAGGTSRGRPGRRGVRVRLDAVHRPDPRRHPRDRGIEELGLRRRDAARRLF